MVTVYSTPTCAPCRVAKARLKAANIPFTEVDLTQDAEALARLKQIKHTDIVQTPLLEYRHVIYNIAGLTKVIERATEDASV